MRRRVLAALLCLPLLCLFLPAAPPQAPVESETAMPYATNINTAGLDLPAAITAAATDVSPTITRIGVVSDIQESSNITVKISGSPILVQASYLFPQYQPLIGDFVAVMKQDAQWLVLGTMSGPINSLCPNPSFEEGTIAALPDDWTLNVTSSGAGVPTFTKEQGDNPVSGAYVADFGVDNAGAANLSEADALSASVLAAPGSKWAVALTIVAAFVSTDSLSLDGENAPTFFSMNLEFLNSAGASLSNVVMNTIVFNSDVYAPIYFRPSAAAPFVVAPAGTDSVRVRLEADFFMSASSFTSIFIDNVLLRTVA